MQHRMKEFTMKKEAVDKLLAKQSAGTISTNGSDGYPYTVAVHFVCLDGKIYFHGLPAGEKLENIRQNPKVCFYIYKLTGIISENIEIPCKADAEYESVCIRGNASIMHDDRRKSFILGKIVEKYTPDLAASDIPDSMVSGTAVVEITPESITGKYHA